MTGARLAYTDADPLNTVVPAAVAGEIKDYEQRFASGALVIKPTRQDARSGQ